MNATHSTLFYKNRKDAATHLIPFLEKYADQHPLLLAIPRGGVPIAYHIAKHFDWPVDLLMTKKIGHPNHPEFAVGAVSLENFVVDAKHGLPPTYINEQVTRIRQELFERYQLFMHKSTIPTVRDRTIIIVDDGAATGYTILSSIKMLRRQQPMRIVVAIPVAPVETANILQKAVDELVCPYIPQNFYSVGYHYFDFGQVENEEVSKMLDDINRKTQRRK